MCNFELLVAFESDCSFFESDCSFFELVERVFPQVQDCVVSVDTSWNSVKWYLG